MPTINEIVTTWLDEKEGAVKQSYLSKGLKASGRFGESLENEVTTLPYSVNAKMTGLNYGYFMQNGREPTKGGGGGVTLKEMIRQWIDDKGIVPKDNISLDSLAFLIARKIHRDGIKVPNKFNPGGVFSDVFTKKSIAELGTSIGSQFLLETKSNILKSFL